MTQLWEPKPIFKDIEDGCVVFLYRYHHDKLTVKEKLIEWMANEGFEFRKDYTINSLPYALSHMTSNIEDAHGVAAFFKDPEHFVMLKLKYG